MIVGSRGIFRIFFSPRRRWAADEAKDSQDAGTREAKRRTDPAKVLSVSS